MRGKVAKAMRRAAREVAGKGAKERDVREVNPHQKQYPWLIKSRTDISGQRVITDYGLREVCQHVNHPHSVRGIYRAMKKERRHA